MDMGSESFSNETVNMMNQQLALNIQLNHEANLDDFYWGNNTILRQCLLDLLDHKNQEYFIFIWGNAGAGKSHLLQACCQYLNQGESIYLPLQAIKAYGPQILDGIENHSLICIDDIDSIAGDLKWEEALFHLYNQIRDRQQNQLIVTSQTPPTALPLVLADLKSRLSWGLVFQMHELDDENKMMTLQHHAEKRGFELPSSVAQFLVSRCTRNMQDLQKILDKLDETSLAAQRKITIPFVKNILNL